MSSFAPSSHRFVDASVGGDDGVSDVLWTFLDIDRVIEIANKETGFTGFAAGTVVPAPLSPAPSPTSAPRHTFFSRLGKAATSLVVPGHIIRRRQGASAERRGKTAAAALSCPGAVEAHAQIPRRNAASSLYSVLSDGITPNRNFPSAKRCKRDVGSSEYSVLSDGVTPTPVYKKSRKAMSSSSERKVDAAPPVSANPRGLKRRLAAQIDRYAAKVIRKMKPKPEPPTVEELYQIAADIKAGLY